MNKHTSITFWACWYASLPAERMMLRPIQVTVGMPLVSNTHIILKANRSTLGNKLSRLGFAEERRMSKWCVCKGGGGGGCEPQNSRKQSWKARQIKERGLWDQPAHVVRQKSRQHGVALVDKIRGGTSLRGVLIKGRALLNKIAASCQHLVSILSADKKKRVGFLWEHWKSISSNESSPNKQLLPDICDVHGDLDTAIWEHSTRQSIVNVTGTLKKNYETHVEMERFFPPVFMQW